MEVLARLNTGGMGEVLLVRRKGPHGFERLLALKTIREDLIGAQEMRRMFLDEARLLARLDHPTIAQLHDFGEESNALYLAMEYVPGIALNRLMKDRDAPLPASVAARIGLEVCRGLQAAHELTELDGTPLGVVHRDISPHNLMMTYEGRIKIIDFGVAFMQHREASTTQAGIFKGKLGYVAPEQISGKPIDARTDIYGLSVVLYELLTGTALFAEGRALAEVLDRGSIMPLTQHVPDLSIDLETLVLKGLAHDPNKRYRNARSMAAALEKYIEVSGGETIEAFAERCLSKERNEHRVWLKQTLEAPKTEEEPPTLTDDEEQIEYVSETWLQKQSEPPAEAPSSAQTSLKRPRKKGRHLFLVAGVLITAGVLYPRAPSAPNDLTSKSATPAGVPSPKDPASIAPASKAPVPEPPIPVPVPVPEAPPPPKLPKELPAKTTAKRPPKKPNRRAKPRSKPRASTRGTVSVWARPGGTVLISGRRAGKTPLRRYRLKAGLHQIALIRPGDRKPRWISTVNIRAGKHVNIRLK